MLKTHFKAHQLGKIIVDTRRKRKKKLIFLEISSQMLVFTSQDLFFSFQKGVSLVLGI